MRRSHVCFFGLVATCDVPGTCPTQKLPLFLNLIQMVPPRNKSRISDIPRPGRYRTNIKLKNRKNTWSMIFCICTSMPAEYWYVPRVSYMCRNSIPPVVCSFWHGEECGVAFLCCWVPLPSFPWPVQNNFCHSWVFSRVCWAFACKAWFQLRLVSFFQRLRLSLYRNMVLVVLFCTTVWAKRSS